jgi:hypothetical protein
VELIDMGTKDLLALHNGLADGPAGPKTFAKKAN